MMKLFCDVCDVELTHENIFGYHDPEYDGNGRTLRIKNNYAVAVRDSEVSHISVRLFGPCTRSLTLCKACAIPVLENLISICRPKEETDEAAA